MWLLILLMFVLFQWSVYIHGKGLFRMWYINIGEILCEEEIGHFDSEEGISFVWKCPTCGIQLEYLCDEQNYLTHKGFNLI